MEVTSRVKYLPYSKEITFMTEFYDQARFHFFFDKILNGCSDRTGSMIFGVSESVLCFLGSKLQKQLKYLQKFIEFLFVKVA